MPASLDSNLKDSIATGATIITPNQRAARTLRRVYDAQQRTAGAMVWTPPAIFALETWMTELWRELQLNGHESRLLLNGAQEHTLWRTIVEQDRETPALRSPDALAELAARAWRLLHLYGAPARLRDFPAGTDAQAFRRWAQGFNRRCVRQGLCTVADLPRLLEAACAEGMLELPNAGVVLVDFDALPPAFATFFDSVERAGYTVTRRQTTVPAAKVWLHTAEDNAAELQAAALWARNLHESDSSRRIAIVVPDLEVRRADLERTFSAMIAPASQPVVNTAEPPFEFSLGVALADTAMVAAALDLLRWAWGPLPLQQISRLLVSPFFGASGNLEQTLANARLDAFTLRDGDMLRPELTLNATIELLFRDRNTHPGLRDRLQTLEAAASARTSLPLRTHAEWADAFRGILEAAGWTEAATRDSLSFQTHRRWESVLDELATLDFDGTRPEFAVALGLLQRLAGKAIFAPEAQDAPIQILGPLELGGASFDALWLLGGDDLAWPPRAAASLLLAFTLRRELRMPGAHPAQDAIRAAALTARVAHSASEIVFSYARRSEEAERRLATVIAGLKPADLPLPVMATHTPLTLEAVEDAAPLPPPPDRVHEGGARLLELQAACGFRAFAETRLRSRALGARDLGFDARDRGEIVHQVMERFWRQVKDQQTLRTLTTEARDQVLDTAIKASLASAQRGATTSWDNAYLAVQAQRLRHLLRPWLDLELMRPEFVVRDSEKKISAQVGPLRLSLRVDRVDDTSGGALIIDYKTGSATPDDWLGDRPEQPQLPIYATQFERPGGVAFAMLKAGKDLCLKGYASEEEVLEKPTIASLQQQVEAWRDVLANLAQHYVDGDAAALPREYPATCRYCPQRIVCRLDPTVLSADGEEDTQPGWAGVDG